MQTSPTAARLGVGPLSPRQWEVMARRARGMTIKEIAHDLGLSQQTMKTHFSNADEVLGTMNVAEAFIALGWLRVPGDELQEAA
ncbi:MAG TPA: helix-turn-helix transcriptional regulator [Candidatus Limnocylindrales bacterium]